MTYVIMGYLRKICNHPILFFERLFDKTAYMNAWTYNFKHLRQTQEYQIYTKLYLKDKPDQIRSKEMKDPEQEISQNFSEEDGSTESDLKDEDSFMEDGAKASYLCYEQAAMSTKVCAFFEMLAEWKAENDSITDQPPNKVLVFSQTKKILSLFERMAREKEYSYLRMDGGVKVEDR
mmetsp:Transcript_14172/g.22075  ORF Transcript_14172/g.22075 Transcript_14172/m.22075 type:complete len:177 (+) Transcript_14172:1387-1917(+)